MQEINSSLHPNLVGTPELPYEKTYQQCMDNWQQKDVEGGTPSKKSKQETSTSKVYNHCRVCDTPIKGNKSNWRTHVASEKHRGREARYLVRTAKYFQGVLMLGSI